MHEDDSGRRGALEAELQAASRETARLSGELDAIESDLARVVDLLLQVNGRSDLAIGFLRCLGNPGGTLH
jgi:hypothetical protein